MEQEGVGDERFDGFEWDERKSERCRKERGFDFGLAVRTLAGLCIERASQQESRVSKPLDSAGCPCFSEIVRCLS